MSFILGEYYRLVQELKAHDARFATYFHMNLPQFEDLLGHIAARITKNDTNFREAISPEQRLAVTLR